MEKKAFCWTRGAIIENMLYIEWLHQLVNKNSMAYRKGRREGGTHLVGRKDSGREPGAWRFAWEHGGGQKHGI